MTGFIAPEFDEGANNGLPGPLPAGEHIIWQGSPNARAVGRHVMKTRWIAGYFGVMLAWLLITGFYFGRAADDIFVSLAIMAAAGAIVIGLFEWYAWGVHKTTIYTITTRRVVMKFGVALPTAFNLPFSEIEAVDVRERSNGSGDIALRFKPDVRLAWLVFWPHVRGLRLGRPEPQMIGVDDISEVVGLLSTQLHAHLARTHTVAEAQVTTVEGDFAAFPQAAE
jgi:hypothetical protein